MTVRWRVDAPSLSALVNRALDYKGAALSKLRVSFEEGRSGAARHAQERHLRPVLDRRVGARRTAERVA